MKKLLLTLSILFAGFNASAEKIDLIEQNITLIKIDTSASTKTKPDMFASTVNFVKSDISSNKAQQDLTKKIMQLTEILSNDNVKFKLGSFSSYKEYKTKRTVASQSISFDLPNKKIVQKYTTMLQKNGGKITNTRSYLSQEATQMQFENLFNQAYDKAHNKAKFINNKLNGKQFNIINIDYYMNQGQSRQPYMAKSYSEGALADTADVMIDNSNKNIALNLTMNIAVLPKQ